MNRKTVLNGSGRARSDGLDAWQMVVYKGCFGRMQVGKQEGMFWMLVSGGESSAVMFCMHAHTSGGDMFDVFSSGCLKGW